MIKGLVIGGGFSNLSARQKFDSDIEIGELLVAETGDEKILMQVFDLVYGSQISPQNLELISGMNLEEGTSLNLMDSNLRNYKIALMKGILSIKSNKAFLPKKLPNMFSEIREIKKEDLDFLTKPKNSFFVGNLRSGSKELDVPIYLDGEKVLSHHVLVTATTGRGKSNLTSCILWDCIDKDYCGMLVLDPHDEYYGRNGLGMKDHNKKDKVIYYSVKNVPSGCRTLKINLKIIKPHHFEGVIDWSDAQQDAINSYFRKFKETWIHAIIFGEDVGERKFSEGTFNVIKRKMMNILDLDVIENNIFSNGVFDLQAGEATIFDICNELETGKTVIIDTSSFDSNAELLIGSMISTEILRKYKNYKAKAKLDDKPVVSIVLEEAPRVLGKEILEKGQNIFSTIAREGRKFKIGLYAITQLPSLIPREILANINTKIILGIEMKPERQAIIESAAQDLSDDDRNIASLDTGEAIISSNFAKFAIPVKIPYFNDIVQSKNKTESKKEIKPEKVFSGVSIY